MKRTTVKIPDELDARLRKEAELRGVTVSALVREALDQFVRPRARRSPRLSFTGMIDTGEADTSERVDEILAGIYEERHRRRGRPVRDR